jgi:competence protein ComEA
LVTGKRSAAEPPPLVKSGEADSMVVAAASSAAASAAPARSNAAAASASPAARIAVDVIGAVAQPGVYWLEPAARVADVVEAAGGFAPDADSDRLNKAAPIVDGQQIRVPRIGESAAPSSAPDRSAESTGGSSDSGNAIDVNRADAAALDTLPGIGPATAEAIIAYREANGPFKRNEDIQNVKGIGPAVYAKIVDSITVGP